MARVLVVEDEPTMRELVSARLKAAGHQIVAAETGAAAVDVVTSRGAPDVAVLDIGLPDVDGYTLLASLRDAAGQKRFGAVFLSGEIEQASIDRGHGMGAIYLTKPFIASALLKAIDQAIAPLEDDDGW
jgi:CheY-like chemotaxis protein